MVINLSDIFNTQLILLLTEATAQEIHQRFYPNIPDDVFNEIVNADPVSSNLQNDKIGVYAKWLLNLYKNNNLKLEDLYKAKEYIPIFDKMTKANKLPNKDINSYKSLPDVYKVVQPYLDNNQSISKGDEERKIKQEGAEKVYEDNRFLVIHVKTKEAAIFYGKGTEWCTAATKSENYFDYYNSQGSLYIVMDKKNNRKYQFHFEKNQYMDETDSPIDFGEHKELLPILGKLLPDDKMEASGGGVIKLNKKFGVLDKNGNWIVKPKYYFIGNLENDGNRIVQISENEYNLIDKNGNLVLDDGYYFIRTLENDGNRIVLITDNEYNLINKNGELVLEYNYYRISQLENDGYRIVQNDKYSLLDKNGILLLEPEFDWINDLENDGYRIAALNGKNGLMKIVDEKINWMLKPELDWIGELGNNGTRQIKLNGKWGLIDKNLNWIPNK